MLQQLNEKNSVILLTIDGLRPDMFGGYGNDHSPTPFLDNLIENNLSLTSCYSAGIPTQFALPGLLTSTLPLDYGGYEFGIRDRPLTVPEFFSKQGYETSAFVTTFWQSRLYGYDRGVENFYPLFDLRFWIMNLTDIYIKYDTNSIESVNLSKNYKIGLLVPFVGEFLESLLNYCKERYDEKIGEYDHPRYLSPGIHGWDFPTAIETISTAKNVYEENPHTFVKLLLDESTNTFLGRLKTTRSPLNQDWKLTRKLQICSLLYSVLKSHRSLKTDWDSKALGRKAKWLTRTTSQRSCSAGYVLKNLNSWIKQQENSYFAWAHLLEVHDKTFFTWELDDKQFNSEIRELEIFLDKLGNSSVNNKWYISQALSMRYLDLTIEKFYNKVVENNDDPPLIILTADHGSMFRHRRGNMIGQFYDEQLHIPVVFIHPKLGNRSYNGLCSSLDIMPTVLKIIGKDVPAKFAGSPITSLEKKGRNNILAEDLGRGPCDPIKPANIAVRTNDKKIVCSIPINYRKTGRIKAAFDLRTDPNEENPLDVGNLPKSFDSLLDLCYNRAEEIRNSMQ